MTFYSFEGLRPVIHPTAYAHPNATLIGDVHVGANCYVGPHASLRGDFGRLVLEEGANVQDNCTLHSFPGKDCVIGRNGHIGHGAVLHGCTIGRDVLIGMNCVVMDEAVVGDECIVGAMSFVKARTIMEAGTLWLGVPAKFIRAVTQEEKDWKARGTAEYQNLARKSRASLLECEPLDAAEQDRARLSGAHIPLAELRKQTERN